MANVIIAVFSHLLASPAALQPGDPLYYVQDDLVETVATALPWLVPGAIGAAAVVLAILRDGF